MNPNDIRLVLDEGVRKYLKKQDLIATPSLFPPTFSILIFNPKLAVAHMCVTTLLALVPPILNLQNFLPSV